MSRSRVTEYRRASTGVSAIGDHPDRGERGDDAVAAGLVEHLDRGAVARRELRQQRLVDVWCELDGRANFEASERIGGVEHEQRCLRVAREVAVLLAVRRDGSLEHAVVVDEEPDRGG